MKDRTILPVEDGVVAVEIERTPIPETPCPRCGRGAPVRSPHIQVASGRVRIYCSAECLQAAVAGLPLEEPAIEVRPRRRWVGRIMIGVGVAGAILVPHARRPEQKPAPIVAAVVPPPALPPKAPAPPTFGPPWPPTDKEVMAELAEDAWFHPLAGPDRRMPISDGRVFGAERPGERPAECRSGHCGVDIGGEQWGEPVMAAHDGVIDRVVRGPNEEHGGLYVRIGHRGNMVFTQYFHLAAIPRRLTPGMSVKAGEVIGLLGDTGVKESKPHLHFTVSVKPSSELPERYIDPEPLIALWPIRVGTGRVVGIMADAKPGFPRGANGRKKKTRARTATSAEVPEATAPEELPAAD